MLFDSKTKADHPCTRHKGRFHVHEWTELLWVKTRKRYEMHCTRCKQLLYMDSMTKSFRDSIFKQLMLRMPFARFMSMQNKSIKFKVGTQWRKYA